MHVWIAKRSQTCGSLGGSSASLGFGHPPRRLTTKSMVTPIHRLQSNNTIRPYSHNSNNINNNSIRTTNSSNNSNGNRNNRNRSNHNGSIPYQQQQHDNNHQHQHRHQNISVEHHNHHLQRSSPQTAATLPHNYSEPSHAHDLEQGPCASIGNMAADSHIGLSNSTFESQMLPSHVKCGMWASLVLASVFVAGAKFYFDHQDTGLEVLIFCAFSATFFLAACIVSLCRLPRDLISSPSVSVGGYSCGLDEQLHHSHSMAGGIIGTTGHQLLAPGGTDQIDENLTLMHHSAASETITSPPPPYHNAILLPPDNGKEVQFDDTPPPSYDKILIS